MGVSERSHGCKQALRIWVDEDLPKHKEVCYGN